MHESPRPVPAMTRVLYRDDAIVVAVVQMRLLSLYQSGAHAHYPDFGRPFNGKRFCQAERGCLCGREPLERRRRVR